MPVALAIMLEMVVYTRATYGAAQRGAGQLALQPRRSQITARLRNR